MPHSRKRWRRPFRFLWPRATRVMGRWHIHSSHGRLRLPVANSSNYLQGSCTYGSGEPASSQSTVGRTSDTWRVAPTAPEPAYHSIKMLRTVVKYSPKVAEGSFRSSMSSDCIMNTAAWQLKPYAWMIFQEPQPLATSGIIALRRDSAIVLLAVYPAENVTNA